MTWLPLAAVALLLVYPTLFAAQGARAGRRGGLRDRVGAVNALATSLLAVALLRALVPWEVVPPVLWALPVAATALGALTAGRAWRSLPRTSGSAPRWRLASSGAGALVMAALLAVVVLAPLLRG